MIIGTPIERLDPFTLSLLSNDEVLEINQDPLGKQARPVKAATAKLSSKIWKTAQKPWLVQSGAERARVSLEWPTLGLQGRSGSATSGAERFWRLPRRFAAEIAPHGVVLVRLLRLP